MQVAVAEVAVGSAQADCYPRFGSRSVAATGLLLATPLQVLPFPGVFPTPTLVLWGLGCGGRHLGLLLYGSYGVCHWSVLLGILIGPGGEFAHGGGVILRQLVLHVCRQPLIEHLFEEASLLVTLIAEKAHLGQQL